MNAFLEAYSVQLIASMQAAFCGGCSYLIAFKFMRGSANYKFIPTICAFGLASALGMQWLSLIIRVLIEAQWPVVSVNNTMVFAILFVLLVRSRGNVARMFDFNQEARQ